MTRDRTSTRRFTFADLMVLVAATAAGLALLRPYLASFSDPGWRLASSQIRTIEATYGVWSCIVTCWMMALVGLRYRRPRPARARLARRPGHVACCVAAVALVVGGLHELERFAFRGPALSFHTFQTSWITISARVGPSIAGAWLVLALSGRWRSDPGWMDRLGRALGCCWIGWMFFWVIPEPIRSKIPPFWDGVLL